MISLRIVLLILLSMIPLFASSQTLSDARNAYTKKDYKKTERIIRKIVTDNPEDLDNRMFAVNYCFWENKITTGKVQALNGYFYSPEETLYQYFFYDKMTNNRLIAEAAYTQGSLYDKKSYLLEYHYNYSKKNWFILNYQAEDRKAPFNQYGDMLGLGLVTFLDKKWMLQSGLQFSLRDSFFPNLSIDNELFLFEGSSTYSLDLRFNIYDSETVTFISPHYRYDWDQLYLGGRPYFVLSKSDSILYWRLYGGYKFDYKNSIELGTSFGKNKDDGIQTRDFISYDARFKHRFSERTELSLKYIFLNNYGNRIENTYLVNLLWKY